MTWDCALKKSVTVMLDMHLGGDDSIDLRFELGTSPLACACILS